MSIDVGDRWVECQIENRQRVGRYMYDHQGDYVSRSQYEKTVDQLNKAKEIIKKFSEFVNNKVEYDPEHPQEHTDLWNELCERAEQFLKEV